jgi:hypothetical protein
VSDWNDQLIAEFRGNAGQLGGNFAGAPVTLLHHRGRKTGKESVAPVMYLADEKDVDLNEVTGADRDRIYAEQASRYPGFGEYEDKTAGIRTIPVLALRRRAA